LKPHLTKQIKAQVTNDLNYETNNWISWASRSNKMLSQK